MQNFAIWNKHPNVYLPSNHILYVTRQRKTALTLLQENMHERACVLCYIQTLSLFVMKAPLHNNYIDGPETQTVGK